MHICLQDDRDKCLLTPIFCPLDTLTVQIERWSDARAPLELQLLVPPGQLDLGERLITAMYSSSPQLADLSDEQLLQLAALADCYGVTKVLTAAAAQLQKKDVQDIPLATAAAVFRLPEPCLQLGALSQLHKLAGDKLQQELGDLEVVWGDKDKQQLLLALPFGALLQLLRDDRTRVASEDTAVYTAQRWLVHNPAAGAGSTEWQQQQLAQVLRLPHCTSSFLASLADKDPEVGLDYAWVYGGSTKCLVNLLAVSSNSVDTHQRIRWLQKEYPHQLAWKKGARTTSDYDRLQLVWKMPQAQFKELFEAAAKGSSKACYLPIEQHATWQARQWSLSLKVTTTGASLYLRNRESVCGGAPAVCDGVVDCKKVGARSPHRHARLNATYLSTGGSGHGGRVVKWGAGKSWSQVWAWLEEEGLVHARNCLHLRATVTSLA
jgi:hypothetical protein